MKRVNLVLFDEQYRLYLLKNMAPEEYRVFCNHNFEHMLTVARLVYLLLLEENCRFISKEMAYAAGLLHDIGRWKEYQDGTDHALQSAILADPILERAGFAAAERDLITKAIAQHRGKEKTDTHYSPLSKALRKADSMARLCFQCGALKDCRSTDNRPHTQELEY
ncbi:MAG: HD domain-containing protein [Bacillota bacterium]